MIVDQMILYKFSFDAKCQIVTSQVSSRQNGMREGEDGLDDVEK